MKTHKTGWYVIYNGGAGENLVHFASRPEAAAWASRYCPNTRHRIVRH